MSAPLTAPSRVVASYQDYAQAQYAVDALADRKLPVDELAIVGAGLQSYERITGRAGYARAGLGGLGNGAVVGALLGWLLGLLTLVLPLVSVLVLIVWGLLIGAVVGAILGLVGHAALGGRRDFSSVSSVRAERYDLLAAERVAEEIGRALDDIGPMPAAKSR